MTRDYKQETKQRKIIQQSFPHIKKPCPSLRDMFAGLGENRRNMPHPILREEEKE